MKPYEVKDASKDGCKLFIHPAPAAFPGTAEFTANDGRGQEIGVYVAASEVPAAALALYEAAGLPAPVILPRQETPPGLTSGACEWRPYEHSILAARRVGNEVRVEMERSNGASCTFPPAKAREMAAVLATLADEAEAEPDPAELEQLATVIHRANCKSGQRCVQRPDDTDLVAARAVLLARWKREPQG